MQPRPQLLQCVVWDSATSQSRRRGRPTYIVVFWNTWRLLSMNTSSFRFASPLWGGRRRHCRVYGERKAPFPKAVCHDAHVCFKNVFSFITWILSVYSKYALDSSSGLRRWSIKHWADGFDRVRTINWQENSVSVKQMWVMQQLHECVYHENLFS